MKGWGKVYICIFDGPGLERGQRSDVHNKRKTKTTAYDKGTDAHTMGTSAHQMGTTKHQMGTSAWQMGTAKKYKMQNPATRKKQNPATRKKSKKYEPRYDAIEFGRKMDVAISGFFAVGVQLPMRGKRKAELADIMGVDKQSKKFNTAYKLLKDHEFRNAK